MMEFNLADFQYNINDAITDYELLKTNTKFIEPRDINGYFIELRKKLIKHRDYIFDTFNLDYVNSLDYKFDLHFGLGLYEILQNDKNFSNRVATNNDFWRYLSIRVVPDIVQARWSKNGSEDRFYKQNRRIWLKAMYWYIHLSWQGSHDMTLDVLKNNSTDTVVQLVERAGQGYNIGLYREIIKQYAKNDDRKLFRSVMKLNTAMLINVSPELVDGGITTYVRNLFNKANPNFF